MRAMSAIHCHVQVITRGGENGRSISGAAAYRAGVEMTDERTGRHYDYTGKSGVLASSIIGWSGTRQELWTAAEKAERRKVACTGREVRIDLPMEHHEKWGEMVYDYCTELHERYGVAVDVAVHAPSRTGDQRNYHAHILMTTREVDAQGNFGKKTRKLDGFRNGKEEVEHMRQRWAEISLRPDQHLSYEARGIDKIPTMHVGHAGRPDWVLKDRKAANVSIEAQNRAIEDRKRAQEAAEAEDWLTGKGETLEDLLGQLDALRLPEEPEPEVDNGPDI